MFGVNVVYVKPRLPGMGPLPFTSYGRSVHHLLLVITESVPLSDLEAYVIFCPNVRGFGLWIKGTFDPFILMAFSRFLAYLPHLEEISINTDVLPRRPDESLSQVFARVTHLDIVSLIVSPENCRPPPVPGVNPPQWALRKHILHINDFKQVSRAPGLRPMGGIK